MRLPGPEMLDDLTLARLNPDAPAHAAVFSLPVPPGAGEVSVDGALSQSAPIAWWPQFLAGEEGAGAPRRLIVTVSGSEELPAELRPARGAAPDEGEWTGPEWEVRVLEHNYAGTINWEVDELVLRHGEREIGLRPGLLREDGERMWWEWLRVEEQWAGPACRAIRAAGYASAMRLTRDHPDVAGHRPSLWTHRHHWLLCEVYALLFANGVVHLTVRHVNNRLYDYGRDVPGVPIIGLRCGFAGEVALTGETVEVDLGGALLSTEECRTMAAPDRPGSLVGDGEVTVFRPYQGVEITLDGFGRGSDREPWVCHPDECIMPCGAARSVRFALSLGDAPPRVERYVVPHWWYGLCAELAPDSLLPVSDERDAIVEAAGEWLRESQLSGIFNDGSVPRGGRHYRDDGSIAESGWEGEAPFNLVRYFYRRATQEAWEAALRSVYNTADIAVDHANHMFRMHGYDFGAISITMNRTLGILQGYLETGDPYLRETAEHVALASSIMDASNWPRRSYGRDAMWIRGIIGLADYLPGRGLDVRAREALGRVIQCIRPEGAYTDQGGPAGVHAAGNMILKPWMNFMVLEPMMDWLERHPEDEEIAATARRIFDWQLQQIVRDESGVPYFPYEVAWGDNDGSPQSGRPHPYGRMEFWYPARALLFATRRWGDPAFLAAWEEIYAGRMAGDTVARIRRSAGDHTANKAVECAAWHQLRRWNARWINGELVADPYVLPGERLHATIHTPTGPREVQA